MERRKFLAVTGTSFLGAFAGCAESSSSGSSGAEGSTSTQSATDSPTDSSTDASTPEPTDSPTDEPTDSPTDEPTDSPTDEPTDTPTEEPTETPTEEPTDSPTPTETSSYEVRISYDGEWSGTVGGDGSTRSVDGSGTETFDVSGDPMIVSANGQKQDGGSGELTVEILQSGEVIARQSTTAEYGVAQVTSEDGISDGGDSDESGSGSSSDSPFEVKVDYDGEWQGSISAGGSSQSVDGSGSDTIGVDGSPSIISANAQKQDDSSSTLTIQILKDGEVVKEASTSAEYGMAQISYSAF